MIQLLNNLLLELPGLVFVYEVVYPLMVFFLNMSSATTISHVLCPRTPYFYVDGAQDVALGLPQVNTSHV